jgi:hypothetical protein
MISEYGRKKGKQVFYASENAGKIKGVHKSAQVIATLGEFLIGQVVSRAPRGRVD